MGCCSEIVLYAAKNLLSVKKNCCFKKAGILMCKVSVVIATYNGEKFITEQLKSILGQLNNTDEVIISDNDSTDNTINIIKCFNDDRIRIYKCRTKGIVPNFENALRHCTGDILFLADQDDVWKANKVEMVKAYLKDYDLVMTDCVITDESLNPLYKSFYKLKNAGKGLVKNLVSNTYQGSNMAFKRKVMDIALPFPNNIPMHDMWIGFVCELFFSVYFIPEKLSFYRRHSDNASTSSRKSEYSFFQQLRFRLQLLKNISLLIQRNKLNNS